MEYRTDTYSPELRAGLPVPPDDPAWCFVEHGLVTALEHDIETRFAIGNGFLGVRGSLEEGYPWSRPRTFVAGLFDRSTSEPPIPALVPAPDWLCLRLIVNGQPLALDAGTLQRQVRTLDVRHGTVWRDWQHATAAGDRVHLRTVRWATLHDRHSAVQLAWITTEHPITIALEAWQAAPDARLTVAQRTSELTVWRTRQSGLQLAIAAAAAVYLSDQRVRPDHTPEAGWRWTWQATPDTVALLVRLVTFARGRLDSDPAVTAATALATARAHGPGALYTAHTRAWQERWDAGGVELTGDDVAQRALRFAAYHLIGAANPADEAVSIGARALSGDAYLGHVFWDTEIFLLPFYIATWPAAARALLMYRYHTLPAARAKAAQAGYRGALYAWESADTGAEATPPWVRSPDGDQIEIRAGRDEHHISADIAYAVWLYWHSTGDDQFLLDAGAEMICETARFWASRATLEADGHYHIRQVVGPDEYHENVDDNAYTNELARWNLERALELVDLLARNWPERAAALATILGLTPDEQAMWRAVADGLVRRFDPHGQLFEQFAGYFGLEPIDLAQYATRTAPMDVILGRERTQGAQVIKQADVVMLLALLWDRLAPDVRRANFAYYEPRTAHGSSLSPAIHALVAARLGNTELALRYFHAAAAIDLDDTMGNAAQGVHIATLGGLWQAAVFGFGGLSVGADGLRCDPHLPAAWRSLGYAVQWRGRRVRLRIDTDPVVVTATLETGAPLAMTVGQLRRQLQPGQPWSSHYDSQGQVWREVVPC